MSPWTAFALAAGLVAVAAMILNSIRTAAERATADQKLILKRLEAIGTDIQALAAAQIVAAFIQDRLQSPHYREHTEQRRALEVAKLGSVLFRVTSKRALAEAEQSQDSASVEQLKQKMAELDELDQDYELAKDMAWELDPRNPEVQEDFGKIAASLFATLRERVKESAQ